MGPGGPARVEIPDAVACFEVVDWPYVEGRISHIRGEERLVGEAMKRVDDRVRRRARDVLTEP